MSKKKDKISRSSVVGNGYIKRDRNISISGGNYNENIAGDYVQGDKTNRSRQINITGGKINVSGAGAFNLGDISGTVANTINQIPSSSDSNDQEIKELLEKLLEAIETETSLDDLDKEDALEEVQNIAEASINNDRHAKTTIITKSVRRLGRIVNGLPDDSRLGSVSREVLPAIARTFNS